MLKRFFISMLGTVAGIWVALLLVIVGGIMLVGVSIGKSGGDSAMKVQKRSILYLDLKGEISERQTNQPFFKMIQNLEDKSATLEEMLTALEAAANDDRIEGLYIHAEGSAMGIASREELVEAIERFDKSNKWIVAYADSYTQSDYLVASAAEEVYLNPLGSIDIHGVGAMTPFFKGLLDKLGVKMQIVKVGTFKSAVEPFILTTMSEPARLQMQQYCDTVWSYVTETIADYRDILPEVLRKMAPDMPVTRRAETFVDDELVSGLLYRRQMLEHLRDLTDIEEGEDLRLVTVSDYVASLDKKTYSTEKEHVAVYYAVGDIVDTGDEGIVGTTVTEDIVALANDSKVRGLVLRVNSGGGSAFASEQIWEALQYFKSKGKPLYVSMGDYAASGGYYISCGADSIFADRTTLTGSIGVFGMIPDLSGLVTNKFGITFSTVETNANATGVSTVESLTPSQHAALQRSVDNTYDLFTSRVAEGRNMSQDSVKAIAEGRVWVGSRAIELGLVDRLGSLYTTVSAMTDRLGMEAGQVVSYPRNEEKFWEKILRQSGSMEGLDTSAPFDVETMEALYTIKRLRDMNPIQARMEPVIIK